MKVVLAGFNVDTEGMKTGDGRILTPETLSAAYARISRSPRSIDALRKQARKEIEQARRSNRTIIFEMGHHSIAEHAVFNFDIIGISRRAVEELEHFRLNSYTEKSQRYVTLQGDFVIPDEIVGTKLTDDYKGTIERQNDLYQELFGNIRAYYLKKNKKAEEGTKLRKQLENLAKEDGRYILSQATQTQLGATINARNLELMIRRFASHPLAEVRELGSKLYELVKDVAPSILLFCAANPYDEKTYPALRKHAQRLGMPQRQRHKQEGVELIDYTRNADDKILCALLFHISGRTYQDCRRQVKRMSRKERLTLFRRSLKHMELFDTVLREFECAQLTYALTVSAACFGQLKRHRLATLITQDYQPSLGIVIPPIVKKVGMERMFRDVIEHTETVYQKIEKKGFGIGGYVLTNAHQKRVLMSMNLRELYHISRLREDPTAQWDIRQKAQQMSTLARKVMPITTLLLGGKTDYPAVYRRLYGKKPRITSVPEP
ncbi:MAG: FAD-dependent thymidylate synthase [candidate division WOR-3 bacterium]|nr:MAG: FAD-dependent thymidylate synthase [candidate division WOR-3 bacterium]